MTDIRLNGNARLGNADLTVVENDLETDDGLETAVYLSLFTNRRAEDGDTLPTGDTDRGGWWGDAFPLSDGDKIGSRLWLLARSKQTANIPEDAKQYATEALQWLLDDGVSDRVDVESGIVANGILGLAATIYRPEVDPVTFRYNYNWVAQEARRA